MGQKAPRCGVALRGKEVAPVLPDEPGAEEGGDLRAARQVPRLGGPAHDEDGEDGEPERELMDPKAEEVDARTKPMPFEPKHKVKVDIERERGMRGL